MKRYMIKLVGGAFLGGAAMLGVLSACGGGSTTGTTPVPTRPQATVTRQPTATSAPTATATRAPIPTATESAAPPPTPVRTPAVSAGGNDLLAKGKTLFEKTAGGVGCAYCHGLDGKGNGPAGVSAPPNRGATEDQFRKALVNPDSVMTYIFKLSDEEIKALVAYLQYLNTQP